MASHKHLSSADTEPVVTYWSAPTVFRRPAWQALEAHHEKVRRLHLRQLFVDDPARGERMTAEALGIYFDYSRNRPLSVVPPRDRD